MHKRNVTVSRDIPIGLLQETTFYYIFLDINTLIKQNVLYMY